MSRLSRSRVAMTAAVALGVGAVGLALAPAASAAPAPLPAPSVSPASVAPGTAFTVSGTGCVKAGYADFTGELGVYVETDVEDVLDVAHLAADGSWSVSLTFPAGTSAGRHAVHAFCSTYTYDTEYPAASVAVTAPAPAPAAAPAVKEFTPGARPNTAGIANRSTSATTGATARPGATVVKVLKGFQPFEKVTLTLHSTPTTIGTFTADGRGVLTVQFALPAGVPAGAHTLVYEGSTSYFEDPIKVASASGAPATAGSGELAYTGADIALPLVLGSTLLVAGGGLLVAGRRRKAEAVQA